MQYFSQIRQADSQDISSIAAFLDAAPLIHRHLDWRGVLDWINEQPFLLLEKQGKIQAVFAAPPDPPAVAWIRCFAVGRNEDPNRAWKTLFHTARPILEKLNAQIIAVGLEDWFTRVLISHGFTTRQDIVVLEWDHHKPTAVEIQSEVLIRPMEAADIPTVAEVDALSFEPVWVNSQSALQLAFMQSEHASVAEINHRIIGYELSTANQYNAHLARLAVIPGYQHLHIGRALVADMLSYFSKRGILQVTVNTQSDNAASLHLYRTLGFHVTFEQYPVLTTNNR